MMFAFLARSPIASHRISHPLRHLSRHLSHNAPPPPPPPLSYGIELTSTKPIPSPTVLASLTQRGTVTSIWSPRAPTTRFVVKFAQTDVEDALLAEQTVMIAGIVSTAVRAQTDDVWRERQYAREVRRPRVHVQVMIPLEYGVSKMAVGALVRSFGGVKPLRYGVAGLATGNAFTRFPTQELADRFVEAGWTGSGFHINGRRIWVNYTKRGREGWEAAAVGPEV